MFVDIDFYQEKKYNQNAFGDYFTSKRYPTGRVIAVLSDGLGSGVKANILASMTATMLLKFIEAEVDIKQACEIVLNSLPVCQVRKISYSTFSAMDCDADGNVNIVEEGNPDFLWIRNYEVLKPECKIINSKTFPNRHMHIYKVKLEEGDRLIFCSDGVTQAAMGTKKHRLGLRREGLIDIVLRNIAENAEISSRNLSKQIVREAILSEPDMKPKDDVSAVCVYYRKPRKTLIFTGPPYHQEKDSYYAEAFKNFEGKKAICGGTTASLISRELNIPIKVPLVFSVGKLPAVSQMEGVDLVTEGILTLTKTLDDLEKGIIENDAAGKLIELMLNSDCIDFLVGAKINQAHYDPNIPIEIEVRKNVIRKIKNILEEKYMKKVLIKFM